MDNNTITKIVSFAFVLTILAFVGCGLNSQQIPKVFKLFSDDGKPSPALCDLLAKAGIEHDNTVASIVAQTQKTWLRPAGVERFELEKTYDDKRAELWPLFDKVGLVNECYPSKKSYEYCLVLGATIATTRVRLAYVARLWQEGIRFKQLILLTGARVLDPKIESISALCNSSQKTLPIRPDWKCDPNTMPKTEAEMMRLVYDQAVLPSGLRDLGVTVIDTPQQMTNAGTLRRPNTGDTLVAWLATKPSPGSQVLIYV